MAKLNGAELIYRERNRQLRVERWSAKHDDAHRRCELARAAECYCHAAQTATLRDDAARYHKSETGVPRGLNGLWPWASEWWKPSDDPICNLVKAGALIAAEIDRLQRLREVDS
jgi:hypothetical protein